MNKNDHKRDGNDMYDDVGYTSKEREWLNDLEMLLFKYSGHGIGADVYSMSLIELWALYQWLKHFGG